MWIMLVYVHFTNDFTFMCEHTLCKLSDFNN
jgi:hypothetical protein